MSQASHSSSAVGSGASSSTLTGTTKELFDIWLASCQRANDASATVTTKKEALRREANRVFESLSTGTEFVTDSQVVLKTKSSHEQALALLIQQFGPAFAERQGLRTRLCALSVVAGAIEGCQHAPLSMKIVELFGTFLSTHCGPILIEEENLNLLEDEDWEEQIRDTAVEGLTALLACSAIEKEESFRWVHLALRLAKSGVERRCAAPEEVNAVDYPTGYDSGYQPRLVSGLSTLPRSRRSLCFGLLQAAVERVAATLKGRSQISLAAAPPSLEIDLISFASFTATCLHGESDPRCLHQLLRLFSVLLAGWYPFFAATKSSNFPIGEIFDSVAPYYPIQFSPPPNDVHGITKDGLRHSLMAVLGYTAYDRLLANNSSQETMLNLSLGIVLERLVPPPDEEPSSLTDKREGLQDLDTLLFPPSDMHRVDALEATTVRHISNALLLVHDESCLAVARGVEGPVAKELAESCRTLVGKIALELERSSSQQNWQTFVAEPLQALSSRLMSSPSQGRTAIAYMACLCASGGPKTLRASLEAGLVVLLDSISPDMQGNEEDTATALYGIGAFFSSCRVAIDKAHQDGIIIVPHPLLPYSASALDKLYGIFPGDENDMGVDMPVPVRIAAVRAMESVLMVSKADQFSPGQLDKVARFVQAVSACVLDSIQSGNDDSSEPREELEWRRACTQTLGSILGKAMDIGSNGEAIDQQSVGSVLETDSLRSFLFGEVFTPLVSSAKLETESENTPRYDRMALAFACSQSLPAASRIVGLLLESLHWELQKDSQGSSALACAEALSFILCRGGTYAAKAYQRLQAPSVTHFDVLDALASGCVGQEEKKNMEATLGMSSLQLPPTTEEREKMITVIDNAYRIIPFLLSAFQVSVSTSQLEKLVSDVSNTLPPLEERDVIKLSIDLPFLAAALDQTTSEHTSTAEYKETEEKMASMPPELADFALVSDYYPSARSYAADCLHSLISRFLPLTESCPALELLTNAVSPFLASSIELLTNKETCRPASQRDVAAKLTDGVNMASIFGSAAACRGGVSSKTADCVVLFLVDLACSKKSTGRFLDCDVDFTLFDRNLSTELAITAASAFGSILSVEGGGVLWKQRLTHIGVRRLVESIDEAGFVKKMDSASPVAIPLGTLAAVCEVVCTCSLRSIRSSDLQVITATLVAGLLSISCEAAKDHEETMDLGVKILVVKKSALAAVLKLICSGHNPTLSRSVFFVVTGLLRAYAGEANADPASDILCKILALQGLAAVTRVDGAKETLSALQRPVVSMLSVAMNHPSSLLRQAAVEVRNTWLVE